LLYFGHPGTILWCHDQSAGLEPIDENRWSGLGNAWLSHRAADPQLRRHGDSKTIVAYLILIGRRYNAGARKGFGGLEFTRGYGHLRMISSAKLIAELEDAVASGSSERRTGMLRLVTDLFLGDAEAYSDEQVDLFDNVMGRLANEANVGARVELAQRLAPAPRAPSKVVSTLANDDELQVAEPVRRQSTQLDDVFLSQAARNKGQGHLLAISKRGLLSEVVTDALLERGDREVVHSTAANDGARFSPSGFSTLVEKSAGDGTLAETVGKRADVPTQAYMRLLADADDEVRHRLIAANPHRPPPVTIAATGKVKAVVPRDYLAAQERLAALKQSGQLGADTVDASVRGGSFAEVIVAIALLTGLPIGVAENALLKRDLQLLMILAKACQLTWSTVLQILTIRCQLHGRDLNKAEFDRSFEAFNGVQPATAQRVLRFMRVRQAAGV
jgi:uncharacterized protein (DUF2336 family)